MTMPTVRRRRRDSLAERRAETSTSAGSSASSSSRARVQFRKLGAKSARVRPTPIATMATSGMRGLNIFIQDIRNAPNKEAEQARVDKELANIRKKFKKIKDMTAYDKKKCVHLAPRTRRARRENSSHARGDADPRSYAATRARARSNAPRANEQKSRSHPQTAGNNVSLGIPNP